MLLLGAVALVFVGLADAARKCRPCHPDLPGTRAVTVVGDVASYRFQGQRVVIGWTRGSACSGTTVWSPNARPRIIVENGCGVPVRAGDGSGRAPIAAHRNRVVRLALAPRGADAADRLDVFERTTGRRVASWPLIERPARVALYGDLAILSAARRDALYALRVTDGTIAMIGITRRGDRPLIGPSGVLYRDDLDVAQRVIGATHAAPGADGHVGKRATTLKLVPLAAVERELARVGRPVRTSPVAAMAMDGPRVAFAVSDPTGRCDRILFWNIPWHFVSRLTQPSGPSCLPTHEPGGITDVAIAGSRAIWTTRYGGETRVLAASIINCEEWVVARPTAAGRRVSALSGDGGVLAYSYAPQPNGSAAGAVGIVPERWRGVPLAAAGGGALAVSADGDRIAALRADGSVSVVSRTGRLLRRLAVGRATSLSLRADRVAVVGGGRLDVYDLRTGARVHGWSVPATSDAVDLHFGVALVTAGRDVLAFNVRNGRHVRLLHAPGRVAAQLEAAGAAIQFNAAGHGNLRFVPMHEIEALTT